MALEDMKESVPERDSTAGTTTLRLDQRVVDALKQELGVSQNKEVAPAAEAALAAYIGDDDAVEEYKEKFKNQFEEE